MLKTAFQVSPEELKGNTRLICSCSTNSISHIKIHNTSSTLTIVGKYIEVITILKIKLIKKDVINCIKQLGTFNKGDIGKLIILYLEYYIFV